jgi:ABC-type phosphate/phosphonate transport system substrate-binding protein
MMKKVFFAFAIAGMFGFAACGSNNTETADTMVEQTVEAAATEMTEETTEATETLEGALTEAATEAVEEVVAQ